MITYARLRDLLVYDASTGIFKWRCTRNHLSLSGAVAGYLHHSGYRNIRIDGKAYMEHRLAWLYSHGEWPPEDIDHIDSCRANNRLDNLRLASRSQNMANALRRSLHSTGAKGVRFRKETGRYQARIKCGSKLISLGSFATIDDARNAYMRAAREFFGAFANAGQK